MKPYWKQDNNIIYQGHVLEVLKNMESESVQMCVTSPPYWGLRDYGLEPQIWDGDENCRHEWGDENIIQKRGCVGGSDYVPTQKKDHDSMYKSQGQFCQLCNAWRGSLGLEPTPELFIEHIVQIFREVKRVLRNDGTVWLNLGDSYNAGRSGGWPGGKKGLQDWEGKKNTPGVSGTNAPGLKPKDLIGIPWRVALALQADGWYLRSDIIWAKQNPMPESVTDRPTKAHEYLFLLSKSPKYYYDADAIREESKDPEDDLRRIFDRQHNGNKSVPDDKRQGLRVRSPAGWKTGKGSHGSVHNDGREKTVTYNKIMSGRNKRTVWTIATQPMPEAHFATFPEKLIEPCILAGTSEKGCCVECGASWERVVDVSYKNDTTKDGRPAKGNHNHNEDMVMKFSSGERTRRITKTLGWQPTCKCKIPAENFITEINYCRKPCLVLDPFFGSGTTGMVAHNHGRNFIGIELSESYLRDIAVPRIERETNQLKLF